VEYLTVIFVLRTYYLSTDFVHMLHFWNTTSEICTVIMSAIVIVTVCFITHKLDTTICFIACSEENLPELSDLHIESLFHYILLDGG
jgi:hypothetical protein